MSKKDAPTASKHETWEELPEARRALLQGRFSVEAFAAHLREIQRGDFWMAHSYLREAVFYADVFFATLQTVQNTTE